MPTSPSLLARAQAGAAHGAGHHRGRSPQVVGDDRGRRRPRAAARLGPVHHRPGRLRGDADLCEGAGPIGSGRSRAPTASGRPLAQRLLEAGEQVVDVPAKLAARVRLFDTGHNRKTDALDAHSIAVVAVRTKNLRVLKVDGELEALRMLTDRREALTRRRVQTVCRLQALLAELLPGQAKRDITAAAGQGDARHRAAARPRRQDPPPDRGRRAGRTDRGRGEDQEGHRRAQGHGARPRLTADGPPRCRRRRRGPDPGRRRRRRPVRRPEPVRVLDRHRTPGRLLRRAEPAPAVPSREPSDEPHDPHRRGHPAPPRHRRPRLLPTQASRREEAEGSDPLPQATDLRRHLPPARRRRPTRTLRRRPSRERVREGTAGRLKNPARSTCPRTSTLRISHFPDPHTTTLRPHRRNPEDPRDPQTTG